MFDNNVERTDKIFFFWRLSVIEQIFKTLQNYFSEAVSASFLKMETESASEMWCFIILKYLFDDGQGPRKEDSVYVLPTFSLV